MPSLKPFLLERKILPKVWGGRALESLLGLALPAGQAIGETWELFDRPEGSSRLRGSSTTIADLLRDSPVELLGRGVEPGHGGRFPLMLKFLDAREALSVQVHPDDDQARGHGDGGKNEASIVLAAGPRARIVCGLRPGVDRATLEAKAATPEVEQLLWVYAPRVGDCVHVPPGRVHAIGPDVVAFEVQQNSDLTYRLYDWGRPREVHVQRALAVARLDEAGAGSNPRPDVPPVPLPDGGQQIVATQHFRVRRYDVQQRLSLSTGGRFVAVTVLAGSGTLGWSASGTEAPLPLAPGDTVLVPAVVSDFFLSPSSRLDVLVSDPGER